MRVGVGFRDLHNGCEGADRFDAAVVGDEVAGRQRGRHTNALPLRESRGCDGREGRGE